MDLVKNYYVAIGANREYLHDLLKFLARKSGKISRLFWEIGAVPFSKDDVMNIGLEAYDSLTDEERARFQIAITESNGMYFVVNYERAKELIPSRGLFYFLTRA